MPVVSLRHLAGELQLVDDQSTLYLDRRTGETMAVLQDDASRAHDLEDAGLEDAALPEWERETLATVRRVPASDDWLALPLWFEIRPYRILEDFRDALEDAAARETLARAMRGRGAFRRFRDAIARLGLEDEWYAFEALAYARTAARWLNRHGIPFEDDV